MKKLLCLSFLLITWLSAHTQAGDNDPTFNIADDGSMGDGHSAETIYGVKITTDGKIIIVGNFNSYNGGSSAKVSRLHATGEVDLSYQVGHINGTPGRVIELPTNQILISGGISSTYTGSQGMVRINTNGSIDPGLNMSPFGFNAAPWEIAVQANGKVLAGGNFTMFNNIHVNSLVRVNNDGTMDTSFYTRLEIGSRVNTILPLPDGKIYIGGVFPTVDSIGIRHLARLLPDGRLDTTFNPNSMNISSVSSVAVNAQGKLIVAGIAKPGIKEISLFRLNANGSLDTSFHTCGSDTIFNRLHIFHDGSITAISEHMVPAMGHPPTAPMRGLMRFDSTGVLDTSFDISPGFPPHALVFSFDRDLTGDYIVGGNFRFFQDKHSPYICKIKSDGKFDPQFNPGTGFNGAVKDIYQLADNKLLVSGFFRYFNNQNVQNFVKLNWDGTLDPSFKHGESANGEINAIVVQDDEKIILAGKFREYNGYKAGRIVRLLSNGMIDSTFDTGIGFDSTVKNMILLPNGSLLVSGDFSRYNGQTAHKIIKLNSNGTRDHSFTPWHNLSAFATCDAMSVTGNGKILVGGTLEYSIPSYRGYVNRLNANGTIDNTFNDTLKIWGEVYSVLELTNGQIAVGGKFYSDSIVPNSGLIRLHSNGILDTNFIVAGSNAINTYDIVENDAGNYIIAGGLYRINMIRPNGSVESQFDIGNGFVRSVFKLLIQNDKKIIAGGEFSHYKGIPRNRIARILHDDICIGASGLEAQVLDHQTAALRWIEFGGAQEWHYDYGPVPHTPSITTATGPITDTTDTVYGLTPATNYEFWVRSTCAPSYFSAWAGPFPFRTHADPFTDIPEIKGKPSLRLWHYEGVLHIISEQREALTLELVDMSGKVLYHNKVTLQALEKIELSLPLSRKGIYLLRMNDESAQRVLKIVY